jgi:hypothetical protein
MDELRISETASYGIHVRYKLEKSGSLELVNKMAVSLINGKIMDTY